MNYTEEQKTEAVKNCKSFHELEKVIKECQPFISNSKDSPIEWDYEKLMPRIFVVIDGGEPVNVTRANGLRDKMVELVKRIYKL